MSFFRAHSAGCSLVALILWIAVSGEGFAQPPPLSGNGHSSQQAALNSSSGDASLSLAPILIRSRSAALFTDEGESVLLLRGQCAVEQGNNVWSAPLMILWRTSVAGAARQGVVVYLEGTVEQPAVAQIDGQARSRPYYVVELETQSDPQLTGCVPMELPATLQDPAYQRARGYRNVSRQKVRQAAAQLLVPDAFQGQELPAIRFPRHVTIGPKFLGESFDFNAEPLPGSLPPEWVVTITGGVNIVVDNVPLQIDGQTFLTRMDLTADRAVIWTAARNVEDARSFDIDENTPFQVYLEGNIVVRQGANTVTASHAFYDVNQKRGLALNAEVRSLLPDYQGTLRLRAAQVRQYSETSFHARDAWFTTSEFGQPKYRIQASDIFLEERPLPNPRRVDSATGQPDNSTLYVTSLNNLVFVENVPIFAAPYLAGAAEDPHIPITKLNMGYNGMFGAQLETAWNLDGIFGIELPPGTDWTLRADYLSKRGPGVGSGINYDGVSDIFGMPVHNAGFGDIYYINDHGTDNLGLGRRDLPVYNDNRGRILLRNRTDIDPYNWIQAEIGHVFNNDRNFIEQYFEPEWDNGKDLENILQYNYQRDNLTASLLGSVRTYNSENQTNWLPRGDLTLLGEPLFGSSVLWSSHSQVGYGQVRRAAAPRDPLQDPFVPLYYYPNIEGLVAMSRHELSLPLHLGPVNINPYILGEVAHWEEDLTGMDDLTRWYGSAGVRSSIQFSKYMPEVQSRILGLNGLAHKVTFDAEYYYADSSADFSVVPQYSSFDENAQERFRERYLPVEFGLPNFPPQFDPRFYAVRTGAGRAVTAPYYELVDDQQVAWLGMHHRWQTKVGPPEAPRIVDWMELDLGAAIFPDANRDNFGETLGLINGRYAWHVSPRTSFLASGIFDVFDTGQQIWNVGVLSQRFARGSMYVGFRNVEVGPIDSQLITGSFSYVMSPNLYVATAGAAFDIAEGIDRGESLTITRIGEYFLLHFGCGYDRSRNNVGVALSLEPKFGSYGNNSVQLNSLLGVP